MTGLSSEQVTRFREDGYLLLEDAFDADVLDGLQTELTERIDRCAAINVNPETAERDLNIVKFLQAGFGHIDMGVFVRMTKAGSAALGEFLSSR